MRVASTQRRLLLAVLAGVIMLSAGETPRPTQAVETPACGVGDTLTRYRATSDWYRSLLDTRFRLPRAYAPGDLVSVSRAGVGGFGRIRRVALGDFAAMARAARAARAPFAVQSAYRGYGTQISTSWRWVRAWATGERCWRRHGRATRSTSLEPPSISRPPAAPHPGLTRIGAGRRPEPG